MVRRSRLATASFLLALIPWLYVTAIFHAPTTWLLTLWCYGVLCFAFCLLTAILAIVAIVRIVRSSNRLTGCWLAGCALVLTLAGALFLAALYAPGYITSRQKSSKQRCRHNIKLIDGACQRYLTERTNPLPITAVSELVPTYLKDEPKCPLGNGKPYSISNFVVICPMLREHPDHSIDNN